MTICIYSGGVLYSDRAGVGKSTVPQFLEMKKLFISPCQRFAMSVSGKEVKESSREFKTCMRDLAKQIEAGEAFKSNFILTGKPKDYLIDRAVMLITHRNAYALITETVKGVTDAQFAMLDKELNAYEGSGSDFAAIAMAAGKTPLEAMRISSIVDTASYLTEIDQIAMKDLKPF